MLSQHYITQYRWWSKQNIGLTFLEKSHFHSEITDMYQQTAVMQKRRALGKSLIFKFHSNLTTIMSVAGQEESEINAKKRLNFN